MKTIWQCHDKIITPSFFSCFNDFFFRSFKSSDAPIIILDEATASIDGDNENYIQEAITQLCQGKTLLVIAHRLNTIRYADKILVIADGKIAQSGSHNQLIKQTGIYQDFINVRNNTKGWSQ